MDSEVLRIVFHFYPRRALESPLERAETRWDYDPAGQVFKGVVAELSTAGLSVAPGTRSDYRIAEELVVGDRLRLQLSFLGPFAAIDHGPGCDPAIEDEDTQHLRRTVEGALAHHGVRALSRQALDEPVAWLQVDPPATVWHCLFCLPSR